MGGAALLLLCACACATEYAQMPLYDELVPAGARAGALYEDYNAHTSSQEYEYNESRKDKLHQEESVEIALKDRGGYKYRNRRKDPKFHDVYKFNPNDDFRLKPRRQSYHFRNKRLRSHVDRYDYGDYRSQRRGQYDEHATSRRRRQPRDRPDTTPKDDEMEGLESNLERDLDALLSNDNDANKMFSDDRPFRRLTSPTMTQSGVSEYDQYDHHYNDMQKVKKIKNEFTDKWRPTHARLVPPPPSPPPPPLVAMSNRRVMNTRPAVEHTSPTAPVNFTHINTTTITTTTLSTTSSNPASNTSNLLSLAERSRLSILKKALRKEMQRGGSTSKPPVLLQVTRITPTVVIVEPMHPHLRAQVSENSPSELRNVKRLMRNKLLSNARSVNDLTDNWDDIVCDYIDTSLIKNGVACPRFSVASLVVLSITLLR
ncbi:hypothetical protein ACJJTC_017835 [Scirpophaga incertulas]